MDVTPAAAEGMKIIKSYGDKSFKVNDDFFCGSIIISPFSVKTWGVSDYDEISINNLDNIDDVELIIIGCGEKHMPVPGDIQKYFSEKNIAVESMTTGAACRTYNVLLVEGRKISVALIAV